MTSLVWLFAAMALFIGWLGGAKYTTWKLKRRFKKHGAI